MSQRCLFPVFLTFVGFLLVYTLWTVIGPGIEYHPERGIVITNGQDFLNYWAGPQIAAETISALFNGPAYEKMLHQLYSAEFAALRWSYPLHSLFFFMPFAALPYHAALTLWVLLGVTAFLGTAAMALPEPNRKHALLLLAASPIMLLELLTRQNGFFTGAGALGVLLLLQHKRPVLAGILLGCLTIKPQLFLLWPLMLVMDKQWRCIAAATATTLLLLGTSLMAHGLTAWQQFADVVPALQWTLINHPSIFDKRQLYQLMMVGLTPSLRILGTPDLLVYGAQALLSLLVLAGTILAFRHRLHFSQRLVLLASGSLIITPYAFNYDMTLLTVGLALVWTERPRLSIAETILGGLTYTMPLQVYIFNLANIPIASLLLALVFFGAVHEARQQPLLKASA